MMLMTMWGETRRAAAETVSMPVGGLPSPAGTLDSVPLACTLRAESTRSCRAGRPSSSGPGTARITVSRVLPLTFRVRASHQNRRTRRSRYPSLVGRSSRRSPPSSPAPVSLFRSLFHRLFQRTQASSAPVDGGALPEIPVAAPLHEPDADAIRASVRAAAAEAMRRQAMVAPRRGTDAARDAASDSLDNAGDGRAGKAQDRGGDHRPAPD